MFCCNQTLLKIISNKRNSNCEKNCTNGANAKNTGQQPCNYSR